jgi:hypothetical protein
MTVLITLTTAGVSTGPFDLYSDVDGYLVPFETLVPKASLVSGYTSTLIPNGTTIVRVKSNSVCINFIDITISLTTTTTTTSSSTSTSTSTSTTTTTTTTTYPCYCFRATNVSGEERTLSYTECGGTPVIDIPMGIGTVITDCTQAGASIIASGGGVVITTCTDIPCSSEGDCSTCGA